MTGADYVAIVLGLLNALQVVVLALIAQRQAGVKRDLEAYNGTQAQAIGDLTRALDERAART